MNNSTQIQQARQKYRVNWDIMKKIKIKNNGDNTADALWTALQNMATTNVHDPQKGKAPTKVTWNFFGSCF